jgi:CRISPR-associated protein (TIGR02710 family)
MNIIELFMVLLMKKKIRLFLTVGTGVGSDKKRIDSLAHGLLSSINHNNPDYLIFFGSKESEKTVESLKTQYENKHKIELENYEFVTLEDIDNFNSCFRQMQNEILKYRDDEIRIDYTSGTKTMTVTAAICSILYRKELNLVSGERDKGIVIQGTERIETQSIYRVYDEITLDKVKEFFNHNRFLSAKEFLKDIKVLNSNEIPLMIDTYNFWDKFNHQKAFDSFSFYKQVMNDFPEMRKELQNNQQFLNIINTKNHEQRCYYVLADLLNNAERRFEEGKYDDAIARLYRSLELIVQIRLKIKYKQKTSSIDIGRLNKTIKDESYLNYLQQKRQFDKIKLGLTESFKLLLKLNEDDELASKFKSYGKSIDTILSYRNMSILAHGLEPKTRDEYLEFKEKVFPLAKILKDDIYDLMDLAKFPKFYILKNEN